MQDIYFLENSRIEDNFHYTLPNLALPSVGESLIGFVLRLDYINGLFPGTILKNALPKEKVALLRMLDDIEEIEAHINTIYIASLVNTQKENIEKTKISYWREKNFGKSDEFSKEILGFDQIKICPICIRKWRIPLIFLIKGMNTCLIHGVKLLQNCICERRIDLFFKEDPLVCARKSCNKSYTTNDAIQYKEVIKTQGYEQSIVNSLITGTFLQLGKGIINPECLSSKIQFITRMKNEARKYISEYFNFKITFFDYDYPYGGSIDDKIDIISLIRRLDRINITFYEFLELSPPNNENMMVKIKSLIVDETHSLLNNYGWDDNDWWLYTLSSEINKMLTYKHSFDTAYLIKEVLDSMRVIKGAVQVESDWITVCFKFKILRSNKGEYFVYI